MNRLLLSITLVTALSGAGIASAGNTDHNKSATHGGQVTVTFAVGQREAAQSYFAEQRGKACPPGLAKKNNGCLPPGQAKKRYAVGNRLPTNVTVQPVPASLSIRIGSPPVGFTYVMVDGDLLKLAVGTLLVVDAIKSI